MTSAEPFGDQFREEDEERWAWARGMRESRCWPLKGSFADSVWLSHGASRVCAFMLITEADRIETPSDETEVSLLFAGNSECSAQPHIPLLPMKAGPKGSTGALSLPNQGCSGTGREGRVWKPQWAHLGPLWRGQGNARKAGVGAPQQRSCPDPGSTGCGGWCGCTSPSGEASPRLNWLH